MLLSTGGNISQPQGTFSIQPQPILNPDRRDKHKLTRVSQRPLLGLLGHGEKERSVGIPALDSNLGMEEGSPGKGGAVVLPYLPFQVLDSRTGRISDTLQCHLWTRLWTRPPQPSRAADPEQWEFLVGCGAVLSTVGSLSNHTHPQGKKGMMGRAS